MTDKYLKVPGTVVHHVPAKTRQYVGCPSILVLPDGAYLASHSYFGAGAANTDTYIYRSENRGGSWRRICHLKGQIWSNLFIHAEDVYIMGTDHCDLYGGRLNGRIVIRRSRDSGRSWTTPLDPSTGLLSDEDGYHTAPVPVVEHDGRLWRAMEFAPEPSRSTWRAFVMSVPLGEDPLHRDCWQMSEQYEHLWSESQWIEGNVVVDSRGDVVNVLRSNYRGDDELAKERHKDHAVLLHVSPDGKHVLHDKESDLIRFPGGGVKFTIRFDTESRRYWALTNKQKNPGAVRNRLYLVSSGDLREWRIDRLLLSHPDPKHHAFQYVDWVFDGPDIICLSRTAFDDDTGGADSFHNANYLTFHRIRDFRVS